MSNLIQYTIQFSLSKPIYGFLAIIHQTSSQTYKHNDVNKYISYFDDQEVSSKSDAENEIYHYCDFDFEITKLTLAKSEKEFNQLKSSYEKEIKKLNDDLKKKGKYKPDPRDKK